jgi:hypothetical protein
MASQKSAFSRLGRDENLVSRPILHLQQALVEQVLEEGQSLILARGGINVIARGEIINQIRDPFWALNRVPNIARYVGDSIIGSCSNADHYEVSIRFGSDYLGVALNDRIQCQHTIFMAQGLGDDAYDIMPVPDGQANCCVD